MNVLKLLLCGVFACIVVVTTLFAFHILNYGRPIFAPEPDELPAIGVPLVEALTAYHNKRGRYPASLADGGLQNVDTPYGEFRYQVSDDGRLCSLSIGDYGKWLFEVEWNSETGWYVDE